MQLENATTTTTAQGSSTASQNLVEARLETSVSTLRLHRERSSGDLRHATWSYRSRVPLCKTNWADLQGDLKSYPMHIFLYKNRAGGLNRSGFLNLLASLSFLASSRAETSSSKSVFADLGMPQAPESLETCIHMSHMRLLACKTHLP